VIGLLRERWAGAEQWQYNRDEFCVKSGGVTISLGRLYDEYQTTPAPHRSEVLQQRLAGMLAPRPTSRDELIKCLRPMLRDRAWLELYAIDHHRAFGKPLDGPVPHTVIGDHFAVTLVAHNSQSMATVTAAGLAEAGLSVEDAFAAAEANLRALATGFRELKPGFWVSVEEDDFDASRLLLPRASALEVRGAPVAVAANRNALFVTGDQDEACLEMLAAVAAKELAEERSLAPLLLRFSG
jgi:hypothetical protein